MGEWQSIYIYSRRPYICYLFYRKEKKLYRLVN